MRFVPTLFALPCLCVAPLCAKAVTTSFDSDSAGWSGLTADIATAGIPMQTSSALTFHATGGNPGGFGSVTDPDAFDTFFRAPASFLGNQSAAQGGTLRFDTITDLAPDYNGPDVIIKGNATVLVYDVAPTATSQWNSVSVPLAPGAGWHLNSASGAVATATDFQNALGNVTELWITAEYHGGLGETTGLDNVALTAVPEPAAAVIALGCIAVGHARRRAQQR